MPVPAPYADRMARPKVKVARFEMRLSPAMETILETLEKAYGLPRAHIVDLALREFADKRGVTYPGSEHRVINEAAHSVAGLLLRPVDPADRTADTKALYSPSADDSTGEGGSAGG